MSETFVDLSYRGLALGKRIKLTQVRPATGYLEMPTPMPVGTTIGLTTDEGLQLEAIVAEVHEQVGGSETVAGMLVRPRFDANATEAWWKARTALPDAKLDKPAPAADAGGTVTVKSPRMTGELAVPAVIDDGRSTAVMDAIPPETSDAMAPYDTDPVMPVLPRDTNPNIAAANGGEDDTKSTMMMDAVDLAALGLSSQSGQMAAVKPEDYADDATPEAIGDKSDPSGGTKAKKKRKRRS